MSNPIFRRGRQGAGGIGGLMAVRDHATGRTLWPVYDDRGNVTALVDAAEHTVLAAIEYGPYGELLAVDAAPGAGIDRTNLAALCPLLFSTKYLDAELLPSGGLVYYGYRYYEPTSGKWLNRDPIAEAGGLNLYGFVGNDPANLIDPVGLVWPGRSRVLMRIHDPYGFDRPADFASLPPFTADRDTSSLRNPYGPGVSQFPQRDSPVPRSLPASRTGSATFGVLVGGARVGQAFWAVPRWIGLTQPFGLEEHFRRSDQRLAEARGVVFVEEDTWSEWGMDVSARGAAICTYSALFLHGARVYGISDLGSATSIRSAIAIVQSEAMMIGATGSPFAAYYARGGGAQAGGIPAADRVRIANRTATRRGIDEVATLKSIRRHCQRLVDGSAVSSNPAVIRQVRAINRHIGQEHFGPAGSRFHSLNFHYVRQAQASGYFTSLNVDRSISIPSGGFLSTRRPDYRFVPGGIFDLKPFRSSPNAFDTTEQFQDIQRATGQLPVPLYYQLR